MKEARGGGSLTMLGICGGRPAVSLRGGSGAESVGVVVDKSPEEVVAQYTTLSDQQKQKMLTALRAKMAAAQGEAEAAPVDASSMPTAIVEEMNSISDGHFALQVDASTGTMSLNLRSSISRVGAPAAAAAMRRLRTTDLRLQMLQSDDEASFSAGTAAATKVTSTLAARALSCNVLFATDAAAPVPLCEQVLLLFGVLRAGVVLDGKGETAAALVAFMREEHAELLEAIDTSGDLADDVAERLTAALAAFQAR
jgi:F-type H+-transporting ATPase subunit alpha